MTSENIWNDYIQEMILGIGSLGITYKVKDTFGNEGIKESN